MHILAPHEFPGLLKEINDPPKKLYFEGTLPPPGTVFLSVVGSRNYTAYGKQVCEKLISELAGYPISIVSGLAIGIDGIAHRAALANGLHTVAIPGSGLAPDVLYPRAHCGLAQSILAKGGALLSEFEPDMRAARHTFPIRNRIIAGISRATLIIEASSRSGTLISARLAMEYNRDVLTVPGPIFSPSAQGPHSLLRDGAMLVESGSDVLSALGIPEKTVLEPLTQELAPVEQTLYDLLREPLSKDELMERSSLSVSEMSIALSTLEIKGMIHASLGKFTRI